MEEKLNRLRELFPTCTFILKNGVVYSDVCTISYVKMIEVAKLGLTADVYHSFGSGKLRFFI